LSFVKQARKQTRIKVSSLSNKNSSSLKYSLLINSSQNSHYNILLFQQGPGSVRIQADL